MSNIQKTSWGSVDWLRKASDSFGLSCGIVTIEPHAKQEERVDPACERVCYVLEGRGRVTVNGLTREFGPGAAILIPANARHSFENTGERPVRHLLIESDKAPKEAAQADRFQPDGTAWVPLPDGRTRTGHPLADSAIGWLNEHYAEESGTQELAEANHTSAANLCRVFRRETGETISGYRNRIRVRRAMEMAADQSVPLNEIASLCGYPSESNFYKQFRRVTGQTPGEYRRSARPGEFLFR